MTTESEIVGEALNVIDNMDLNEVYAVSGAMAQFIVALGAFIDLPPGINPIEFGDSLARVAILCLDKQRGKYDDLSDKTSEFIRDNGRFPSPFNIED